MSFFVENMTVHDASWAIISLITLRTNAFLVFTNVIYYLNVFPLQDEFMASNASRSDLLDVQVRGVIRGSQLPPQQTQIRGGAHSHGKTNKENKLP